MDTVADDVEAATEYLSDFNYVGPQCTAILGYLQVTYPWPMWMDLLMDMDDETIDALARQAIESGGDAANSPTKIAAAAPPQPLATDDPRPAAPSAEEAVPPKAGWVWKKGGSKQNALNSGGGGSGGGSLKARAMSKATAKKTAWKKRWLQVNGNGVVVYLKDPSDILKGVEKGRVDLRDYQVRGDLGNKEGFSSKEHGFSLVSPDREIFFGALSDRDKQEWLAYLLGVQQQVTGANRKTMHANARTPALAPFPIKLDLDLGETSSPASISPRAVSPSLVSRREKVGWLYKKGGMSSQVSDPDELRRLFLRIAGSSTARLDRGQVGRVVSDAGMPLTDLELDQAMVAIASFEESHGSPTISFHAFAAWWEREQTGASAPRATGLGLMGLKGAKAKAKSIKEAHSHGRSNWKKRWFMVRGSCLVYYKSAENALSAHMMAGAEKGRVELYQAQIRDNLGVHEASSSQNYGFSVVSASGKEFYLGAVSDHDKQEWITYLEAVIAATTAPRASPTAAATNMVTTQGWLLKKGGSKAHADGLADGSADGGHEHQALREMFDEYDENKDGELCPVEVKKLARELGKDLGKHELEAVMAELDVNGDRGAETFCVSFCSV